MPGMMPMFPLPGLAQRRRGPIGPGPGLVNPGAGTGQLGAMGTPRQPGSIGGGMGRPRPPRPFGGGMGGGPGFGGGFPGRTRGILDAILAGGPGQGLPRPSMDPGAIGPTFGGMLGGGGPMVPAQPPTALTMPNPQPPGAASVPRPAPRRFPPGMTVNGRRGY